MLGKSIWGPKTQLGIIGGPKVLKWELKCQIENGYGFGGSFWTPNLRAGLGDEVIGCRERYPHHQESWALPAVSTSGHDITSSRCSAIAVTQQPRRSNVWSLESVLTRIIRFRVCVEHKTQPGMPCLWDTQDLVDIFTSKQHQGGAAFRSRSCRECLSFLASSVVISMAVYRLKHIWLAINVIFYQLLSPRHHQHQSAVITTMYNVGGPLSVSATLGLSNQILGRIIKPVVESTGSTHLAGFVRSTQPYVRRRRFTLRKKPETRTGLGAHDEDLWAFEMS